ncbi:hypothetical protein QTP70_005942 [Hemibagrus guttatus]|uniref:Transmembrane protein n=1 Tax=Hemibagrus guttatus TaxID=175788 RepID=A0AAE0PYA4_9TELE|nr:hypothetical protein QTP70_005942 [Hemibagrus guttatus]
MHGARCAQAERARSPVCITTINSSAYTKVTGVSPCTFSSIVSVPHFAAKTALTRRGMDSTRSLKVCCGIWHQDVSSRSFKSSLTRRGMDSTRYLKVCCGIWHQNVSSRSFKSSLTCRGMDSTRSLKVCCGIWHQDVSSRSFKSFSLAVNSAFSVYGFVFLFVFLCVRVCVSVYRFVFLCVWLLLDEDPFRVVDLKPFLRTLYGGKKPFYSSGIHLDEEPFQGSGSQTILLGLWR